MGRALKVSPNAHCVQVTANIRYYQALCGYSSEEIAEAAKIGRNNYYRKLKKPEDFTIGELNRMAKRFGVGVEALTEKGRKK